MFQKITKLFRKTKFNSKDYWESRYKQGGNSGCGSYGRLAEFKAQVLNEFVAENNLSSVIEFGCGDGNQLALANYPKYIGLDVSATIIRKNIEKFANDNTKSFFLYDQNCFKDNGDVFLSDVALSLDVLYHLIEENVYQNYIIHLFACAKRFVIIYGTDNDIERTSMHSHEFYRKFTRDINMLAPQWELFHSIENKFKPEGFPSEEYTSTAGFYFYRRKSH
ncbi:MAG: hypothetical protein QM763_22315 [Agriterribacter sp.]